MENLNYLILNYKNMISRYNYLNLEDCVDNKIKLKIDNMKLQLKKLDKNINIINEEMDNINYSKSLINVNSNNSSKYNIVIKKKNKVTFNTTDKKK